MTPLLSPLWKVFIGRLAPVTYAMFLLYLFLPGVIINYRLFFDTFLGDYSLSYKSSLTFSLLGGSLLRFTNTELILVIITGILLGMNISLLILSIQTLRQSNKLSFSIGGVGLVALVSSGCASCGISILSVLGISTALLPLHGVELSFLSIVLLFLSLIVSLYSYKKSCSIKNT